MSEAVALEQSAFASATSEEHYRELCQTALSNPQNSASDSPPFLGEDNEAAEGITIGNYRNCLPVADGLTSEVYRSSSYALKVITIPTTQSIEPHNPHREIKILQCLSSAPGCVAIHESFRDQEQRLVLVFPFMPLTLGTLLQQNNSDRLDPGIVRTLFRDILTGLQYIHSEGIIHRDVKPSAILLQSPSGPALLSDFGTAWHPTFSPVSEPPTSKILDIGTGPYRAPEVLFGDGSYTSLVDMWAAGVMLAETLSPAPHAAMFESRGVHEDGNQLGLILSIFKTLGTPTREVWPEAQSFKVQPFELWTRFEGKGWDKIVGDMEEGWRDLVAGMVKYSKRTTAEEVNYLTCDHSDFFTDSD